MHRLWDQLVDYAQQRRGQISGDLSGSSVGHHRCFEEVSGCTEVSSLGDVHVNDLAVLVHGPVHVPPRAVDPDVCFVCEPAVTDAVTTGSGCVDEEWCESLYPPVDGDVINVDASFREEFFDVAVRQSVTQVPAHSQQDHLRREPVPGKGSGLNTATTIHLHTLAASHPIRQCNGAPLIAPGPGRSRWS